MKTKKLNVIDIMILVCVALIVLATVFRTQVIGFLADKENLSEFTLTFETEPIPSGYSGYILPSATPVEWAEVGKEIGTINSVEVSDAPVHTIGSDGKLIVSKGDDKVLRGTMIVRAVSRDGCFISGTEFIGAGMEITLRISTVVFEATVLSVTPN